MVGFAVDATVVVAADVVAGAVDVVTGTVVVAESAVVVVAASVVVGPIGPDVVEAVSAVVVSDAPVDVGSVGPGVVAAPLVVDSAAVVVTSVAVDWVGSVVGPGLVVVEFESEPKIYKT